ncbi:MAG: isoprenyl transferase [Prevotella sp.]|nr:isoprenyl transferase [Bacteroidaceae bacterium]MBR6828878.1 isoprenyl transferase [Prevotella sp.]
MASDLNHIPQHIAIIMDGNGRWAKAQGLPRTAGHVQGVETVKTITEECVRLGVKYLTLYTFSTENWNRPADEISALMGLVLTNLETELFQRNNVRFRVIGERSRLPQDVQQKLSETEQRTAANSKMTLVVALSYSARWEITEAVKSICASVLEQHLEQLPEISEETVSRHLQTAFMPDPDLLIRTGGELRVSNYLLWQIAYSELYFCDTYWPDFDAEALHQAIASYQGRERRFGKTSEQIEGDALTTTQNEGRN